MLGIVLKSSKFEPHLKEDNGINYVGSVECPLPRFKFREAKSTLEDSKSLVLEYIELEKEIELEKQVLKGLEDQKSILIKKINNNPELQKILNEITQENVSVKTR